MRENEIRQKIKNAKGDTVGYMLAYTENEKVHIGLAKYYPFDEHPYNKERGLEIAYGRAEQCFKKPLYIPKSVEHQFVRFLTRCMNRLSFQGKQMISNIYLYNHENLTYDLMDITEDNVLDIDEN
jgi:hypothetical protein